MSHDRERSNSGLFSTSCIKKRVQRTPATAPHILDHLALRTGDCPRRQPLQPVVAGDRRRLRERTLGEFRGSVWRALTGKSCEWPASMWAAQCLTVFSTENSAGSTASAARHSASSSGKLPAKVAWTTRRTIPAWQALDVALRSSSWVRQGDFHYREGHQVNFKKTGLQHL